MCPLFHCLCIDMIMYVLADEDEPTGCNGTSEEQRVTNNKEIANSDEDISEDDVSEENKTFISFAAPSGTLPYCFVL